MHIHHAGRGGGRRGIDSVYIHIHIHTYTYTTQAGVVVGEK
jgi:hypothetical protein